MISRESCASFPCHAGRDRRLRRRRSMRPMPRPAMPSSTATAYAPAADRPPRACLPTKPFQLTPSATRRICLSAPSMTSADSTPGPERAGVDIDAVGQNFGLARRRMPVHDHLRMQPLASRGTPRGSRSRSSGACSSSGTPGRMPAWQKKKSPNATENSSPRRKSRCASGTALPADGLGLRSKPPRVREIELDAIGTRGLAAAIVGEQPSGSGAARKSRKPTS